jgi:hypothetical protein
MSNIQTPTSSDKIPARFLRGEGCKEAPRLVVAFFALRPIRQAQGYGGQDENQDGHALPQNLECGMNRSFLSLHLFEKFGHAA